MPRMTIDRRAGVRGALLYTLPGRTIVVGVAIKLAVHTAVILLGAESPFLSVVDRVAGLAIAVGAGYFLVQLILLAKRRLLWRVRRKMLVSYIFIGFFPAFFLVAFSLLCAFLLFLNFSSYLVQARLQLLSDQAGFLSQSTALEIQRAGGRDVAGIIAHRQTTAAAQFPEVSIAVLPVARTCGTPTARTSGTSDLRLQTSDFRLSATTANGQHGDGDL